MQSSISALILTVALAPTAQPTAEQVAFFEKRIRPVLVQHCYKCHSAKSKPLRGKLRLDSRLEFRRGGESGPAVSVGKPEASLLMKALRHQGPKMPPSGRLPKSVIADFHGWIQQGAAMPARGDTSKPVDKRIDYATARKLWSLRPLRRPAVPQTSLPWTRNPIDHFVAEKLRATGIKPGRQAGPLDLLRRAHFDLAGLSPDPKVALAFGQHFNDVAYEKMIDGLLASQRFGERWARYWLDLTRFAETYGFEQDQPRPDAWRYRDFVIKSFNDDMPYNEFVRLQIAGDLIRPNDSDAHIATGFLVAGVENIIQSRKEFVRDRYDKIDDMVTTIGTSMLAITVGCCRCHDHKYDAMSQMEYYQLAAPFGKTISSAKTVGSGARKVKSFVATETPGERLRMVTVSEPGFRGLPSIPAKVRFLVRGDVSQPRQFVEYAFPRILGGLNKQTDWNQQPKSARRLPGRIALARWISDKKNGAGQLLARVIVNRLWQHHFGQGIVGTPSDFGTRGDRPTHPKLLDWLASELIRNQWRLKSIHKLIMMSATYRQAFRNHADYQKRDPSNRLLWRRLPRRLDAESIRDNLLKVAGKLDNRMFGPGQLDQNHPRRSVYLKVKRTKLIPILQLFDAPDALQGIGQRQTTTTAPQALMMLNNPFVASCVSAMAKKLQGRKTGDAVDHGFLLAVGRKPTASERQVARRLVANSKSDYVDLCQMLVCLNEFIFVE